MATVYAVASAKGGVGKTTTTAALATILADSGADVVAIDADLGMANLAGAVGVTPGETTLHDVLAGEAEPEAAVRSGPGGLRVLPGATDLDAYAAADPSGLRRVVEAFGDADYVFVDAGAGLSHDSTLPLAVADETLLVSTPERSALGDTEKTRQLTERLGGTVAGAAITRVTADTDEVVTALLDAPVLGRIPDDEAVGRAAAANRPLTAVAPDAPATRAYRDLARALTGAVVDGARLDAPAAEAASGTGARGGDAGGADDDAERMDDAGETEIDEVESEPDAPDDDAVIVDDEPDDDNEDGDDRAEPDEADGDDRAGSDEPDGVEPKAEGDAEDEEIIVADSEATGVAEPDDGDDIIVASETADAEATDGDEDERDLVDDDDGVGEDDEVAVNSEGDEDGEGDEDDTADEDSDAIPDADETARGSPVGRGDGEEGRANVEQTAADDIDDEPTAAEDDIDDELAGSIPFRDDDTGTMNTVLSEGDDGDADAETADDEGAEAEPEAESAADDEDTENGGGFFSRLLGR
ncbi:cobyrinic acid ac-diamide synthase [Halorubrum sp. GN11_10-6_MGM]|uniref:nucleotide-binding protein n=1 Tax=Halorubrum sp. GN11_10-6_MGM TaxID=2518112 RepID=UPI0010F78832|nr:P-loop NTPase [Halorubrum sp. GN11_10-6_MGM]TKX74359.1 cobyrinic acid ac-diamide synthase [Halorubrum sp. GN11_10-6_MGM]